MNAPIIHKKCGLHRLHLIILIIRAFTSSPHTIFIFYTGIYIRRTYVVACVLRRKDTQLMAPRDQKDDMATTMTLQVNCNLTPCCYHGTAQG